MYKALLMLLLLAGRVAPMEVTEPELMPSKAQSMFEMIEEIENAIRILKLTDDEVVSTSTYNSIAKIPIVTGKQIGRAHV